MTTKSAPIIKKPTRVEIKALAFFLVFFAAFNALLYALGLNGFSVPSLPALISGVVLAIFGIFPPKRIEHWIITFVLITISFLIATVLRTT